MDENLKLEINQFIWCHAHPDITLREAEELATKIYMLMKNEKEEAISKLKKLNV